MNRKVKSLMILKGVTGLEIARKAGVTPTWVSLVINRHKKSRRIQGVIADALGVSYESLWNNHCNHCNN